MPIDGPGELTLRTAHAGGDIAPSVREIYGSPRGSRRFALFLHGYANSHKVACRSYSAMWKHLASLGVPRAILNEAYWFYWPGDEALPGWSQATYASKVGVARDAANRLAEYLRDLQTEIDEPIQVVMVAHSLGNRVAMETVLNLQINADPGANTPSVIGIVLMAAAVPVGHMSGGQLPEPSPERREVVLFSLRDKVLRWGFPAGQTMATAMELDTGFFPEAVGRRGQPYPRWTHLAKMDYNHGDYWSGEESTDQVSRIFGRTPAQRLAQHPLITWDLGELRLGETELDERTPGALCGRVTGGVYTWQ